MFSDWIHRHSVIRIVYGQERIDRHPTVPHILLTVHRTVPTMWALGRQQDVVQHMRALPHGAVADALATVRASQASVTTKPAFEFLVLTAARSGEVRLATWDEIDSRWRLAPAGRAGAGCKAGIGCRVPMCSGRPGCNSARRLVAWAVILNKQLGLSFGKVATLAATALRHHGQPQRTGPRRRPGQPARAADLCGPAAPGPPKSRSSRPTKPAGRSSAGSTGCGSWQPPRRPSTRSNPEAAMRRPPICSARTSSA